jgi:hypothetical protein
MKTNHVKTEVESSPETSCTSNVGVLQTAMDNADVYALGTDKDT